MPHAAGPAIMRRIGLLAIGLSFAMMSVAPALSLTQIPAMLERDRVMQELHETPADHKGGGWRSGDYERSLHNAAIQMAGIGRLLSLSGFTFLAIGGWLARHETEGRRVLRTTVITGGFMVASGILVIVAHRAGWSTGPIDPFSIGQTLAVGLVFAFLAASSGSRLALGLGLAAATTGALKQVIILDQTAWRSGLARHGYVTIPLLLWLSGTLTAAAFAAGAAAPPEAGGRASPHPVPMRPTHAQ